MSINFDGEITPFVWPNGQRLVRLLWGQRYPRPVWPT